MTGGKFKQGSKISISKLVEQFRLRTKLNIIFFSFIIIPICFLGITFYRISTDVISGFAAQNVYEIIKKNNEIIDQRLSNVVNSSLSLITDKDLFDILSALDPKDGKSKVKADTNISKILTRYFISEPKVYSCKMVTSYYTFSPDLGNTQPGFLPFEKFGSTYIYSEAAAANGKIVWIPTYDFVEVYEQKDLENSVMEGRYVFSAVRQIDSLRFENGRIRHLNADVEKPVLVIDFLPDFFNQLFENNEIIKNSFYAVISKDGTNVTQSNLNEFNARYLTDWVKGMGAKSSGYDYIDINNEKWILSYDTSSITNWVTVVVVNPKDLTRTLLNDIKSRSIYLAIILCVISLLAAYIISVRVTNPINRMTSAAKKIGKGHFDIVIPEEGDIEFRQLISTINDMSSEIKTLINENYEVKLREKEATIGALAMQLNPHFLYNTINIINWMAIRNKQKDISTMLMSLSHMLNYTIRTKDNIVLFSDDLEWLKKYLYIMQIRFENKFTVEYGVDDGILYEKVPKLFLQPIVENIFTHAFDNITNNGLIRISAKKSKDTLLFKVEDNGKGITEDELEKIINISEDNGLSIGLSNVDKRIKILYGEEYGVQIESSLSKGTTVSVKIPSCDRQTSNEITLIREN